MREKTNSVKVKNVTSLCERGETYQMESYRYQDLLFLNGRESSDHPLFTYTHRVYKYQCFNQIRRTSVPSSSYSKEEETSQESSMLFLFRTIELICYQYSHRNKFVTKLVRIKCYVKLYTTSLWGNKRFTRTYMNIQIRTPVSILVT